MKGGRPSETALLIAKSTVTTAANARIGKFVTTEAAETCEWFLRDHLMFGRLRSGLFRSAWYQAYQRALESQIIPGIQLHYALRKLQLERFAQASLERNARQVIVLGAGFDTLCLRLTEQYRQVTFIEIDHPNTQTLKIQSLSKRGKQPDNLHFISNDFMEKDLSAVLQDSDSIDKKAPTLIIAEGLLMYLNEQVVGKLLNTMRDTFQSGCFVAFTFMVPDDTGKIRFHNSSRLVDWWLQFKNEPFTWGMKVKDVNEFISSCGFTLIEIVDDDVLRKSYLDPNGVGQATLAVGEYLGFAEVGK